MHLVINALTHCLPHLHDYEGWEIERRRPRATHDPNIFSKVTRNKWGVKLIRIMKLTVFLFFVAVLQATAGINAQAITLAVKDAPLEKVFSLIEKQTNYSFMYRDEWLLQAQRVTVTVKNQTIYQVLDLCFKDQPLTYSILDKLIVIKQKNTSDTRLNIYINDTTGQGTFFLQGRVVDTIGNGISNVSVIVKGSSPVLGTKTDEQGSFKLQGVSENSVLIFSHVSMKSAEIKLKNSKDVLVVLKAKVILLNDIVTTVSTGYQEIAKERATGSFVKINNELFNQQASTTVLNRLNGIANGFTIDYKRSSKYSTGIMIRGLSTIGGQKDPLIVLDNFPYDGDLNNINPNDVESVTLLKDAAAASIWGARAGNGVIVITTKKGHFNQPVTEEFSSNITIGEKPDIWYSRPITSSDYIDVEEFLYGKGFYNSSINSVFKPALSPVIETLIKRDNGQISAADADTKINALRNIDVRNDFEKYIYKPSVNQQYALNLRGGSNSMAWIFSGGYDHNSSELSAELERLTLRTENIVKLSNELQLTTGLSYIQSNNLSGQSGYRSIASGSGTSLYPYARFADGAGNPLPIIKQYRQTFLDTIGQGKLLDWSYYPLEDYKHTRIRSRTYDIMAFANLVYKVNKQIRIELQYRYENQRNISKTLNDKQSFYTRNLINSFTQINYSTGQRVYKVPVGDILDQTNIFMEAHNVRAQVNFDRTWGKNRINSLAGAEVREVNTNTNTYRLYGYNIDNLTSGNVDYTNSYPNLVSGFSSFIPGNTFQSQLVNHFVSAFANIGYSLNEKYMLTASARRDAANIFGVNTNQKWTPLWSTGLSWNLSREHFYQLNWLPYLRLSLTYGYCGNIDPSQSSLTTIAYQSTSRYTLSPYAIINRYGNPSLRWEKTSQLNMRADFRTNENRLSGSIEYYYKKGIDLYGLAAADYTSVMTNTIVRNSASMQGSGWDIELNSLNIDGKLKWQTTLLWNIAKNTVTSYYAPTARSSNYITGAGTYTLSPLTGYPVYSIFSYHFAGLDSQTGNPLGVLNKQTSMDYTGMVSDSIKNQVFNGSAVPTTQIAFGNSFMLGHFSMAINILGKFGYYFRRSSISYSDLINNGNGHADFAKRWQNPGDEKTTSVPSMSYPVNSNRDAFYGGSEVLVEKGDHVRLQYITISYETSPVKQSFFPIKKIRFFLTGNNLGILWRSNSSKLDPDYLDNIIPPPASMTIGLNLTF